MKKRKLLLFILGAIALFAVLSLDSKLARTERRLLAIEEKLGGTEIIGCDEEGLKDYLSKKIVRIIGSYSEGTGFALDGYNIITSFHVVDGDPTVKVVYPDGQIVKPSSVVGDKTKDIALIEVGRLSGSLEPSASEPKFNQNLFAAGYALGSNLPGDITVAKGIYTGMRYSREVETNFVQSDATVTEGMSGGPLVNSCGEVVGINTKGLAGLSLFVDINDFLKARDSLPDKVGTTYKIDTTTPLGVVDAFYVHIMTKDLTKAYRLVSDERLDGTKFSEWKEGYKNTLYVDLIAIEEDETDKNKIKVKLMSADWVDGELVSRYFEGYWLVNEALELHESNIKEVKDPEYWWYYYWDEPKWDE